MKLKIAITVAMACASFQASAVDGYKDLKFGMSVEEVIAHQPCSLEKVPNDIPKVEQYACADLSFGGRSVGGSAFFIHGKFLRFAIDVPSDVALSSIKALSEKYGKPSKTSPQADFNKVGKVPGAKAFARFDGDTVFVFLDTQPDLEEQTFIVYTDLSYEKILTAAQSKDLSSDL